MVKKLQDTYIKWLNKDILRDNQLFNSSSSNNSTASTSSSTDNSTNKSGGTYIYEIWCYLYLWCPCSCCTSHRCLCIFFFFFFFTYNNRSSQTVNKKAVKDLIGQMVQQKQSIKSNKTLQFAIHK